MNDAFDRFPMMDWLRGLAAIWVTVFHFNEMIPFQATWWQALCKPGHLGVPAFFVISGWCMASLAARKPQSGRFLGARLVRILIPFWASMAVVLAVVIARVLFDGQNDVTVLPKSLTAVLASLTAATDPVTSLPSINWVYWSLSYELIFYAIVTFGLVLRQPTVLIALLLPLALCENLHRWDVIEGIPALRPMFWVNQFPLFCMGYFLSAYRLHAHKGLLFLVVAAAAVSLRAQSIPAFIVGLTTALLLYPRISAVWMPDILGKSLSAAGRWSYSLYLIHVPLGVHLFGRFRSDQILANQATHVLFDFANCAFCLVMAVGFYRWVEEPSHRMAKSIANQGVPAFVRRLVRVQT